VEPLDQFVALAVAFALSAAIGLERELRSKSAGLRTHTIVGLGSALFMIVSKYGFFDVLQFGLVRLDPSRLASQIVSGIGFIGAGLIFLRRDAVQGLTSAAVVWLTAAVGTAAGAGLWPVAVATVVAFYVVSFAFPPLMRRLPRGSLASRALRVTYRDGEGALRTIIGLLTDRGFVVEELEVNRASEGIVEVAMVVQGKPSLHDLAAELHGQAGVQAISIGGEDDAPTA
jgi:putative Mg2+ transporter-C (MgtC) family protein